MSRRAALTAAALLAASVLLYLPAARGPFLFDDLDGIVANSSVHGLHDVGRMARFWEPSSVSFRPLRYFSYAVDWSLGGGSPVAFHLTNALLHGAAAILLWRLLLALMLPAAPSLLAALLFLVHPAQTGAVAYISGRKDVLGTAFYLLALLASVQGGRARGRWRRALAGSGFLAAGLAAFLAKEMALTLPLAALLLDAGVEEGAGTAAPRPAGAGRAAGGRGRWPAWARPWTIWRRRPVFYGVVGGLGLLAVAAKVVVAPATKVAFTAQDVLLGAPRALRTLAWHVRKALWPWPHAADLRGLFPDDLGGAAGWSAFWNGGGAGATLVGLLLAAALAWAAWRARGERRRQAAGGLLFFALALLPVLNLVPLNEPAAEHYLHLPMAGLAAALAAFLTPAARGAAAPAAARGGAAAARPGRPFAAAVLPVALPAVLVLLAGLTAWRAAAWSDAARLWRTAVAANPAGDRAHNNLGLALSARGDRAGAERAFQQAIRLGRPPLAQAFANLAGLRREENDIEGALRVLDAGLRARPDDALLLSLRGAARLAAGQAAPAREDLERVAAIPGGPAAAAPEWARDRGVARMRTNDAAGAVAVLAPEAAAHPRDASLRTNLGLALYLAGRLAEAEAELQAACALPDAPAIAHRNLAVVLLKQGRRAEAAAALDEARRRGDAVPASLVEAVGRGDPAAKSGPAPAAASERPAAAGAGGGADGR